MIREDSIRNVMASILSCGHDFNFRSGVIEKRISKSVYSPEQANNQHTVFNDCIGFMYNLFNEFVDKRIIERKK